MDLPAIASALVNDLESFPVVSPITHMYNPLVYARRAHVEYLRRYGRKTCEVVLLGMNPGPWGMVQTGVPFGEVTLVRDWLGIEEPVGKPKREHPKRPVLGFACTRSEVSGARLWGWARDTFTTPERFFSRFFVANYCPLAFLEESGRNRTPDRLPRAERDTLFCVCDLALRRTVEYLRPRYVIGIGGFAETRAETALSDCSVTIGRILHPSPASPAANRGWTKQASAALAVYGIEVG